MHKKWFKVFVTAGVCIAACTAGYSQNEKVFKAGAATSVITPPLGYSLNGNFQDGKAKHVHDDTHAKAIVMDDGENKLAIVVSDLCMVYKETLDKAKKKAHEHTGIPVEHMMMSATHTHSGGTACSVFQSDPEPSYLDFLSERIADALIRANNNLVPAEIGWGKGHEASQVHNRRWHLKDNSKNINPFGGVDKVRMNPGIQSPNLKEPAGPIDPEVSVVALKSKSGHPIAVLANYSLHYVGGTGPGEVSADYFGMFGKRIKELVGEGEPHRPFVGIMSNGTSGDINNIDWKSGSWKPSGAYAQMQRVADIVAGETYKVVSGLQFQSWVPLASAQKEISLAVRKPTQQELTRAKGILEKHKGEQVLRDRDAIYARESVLLDKFPHSVPLIIQAFRIGDLAISAIPCEVFVEIGLEIKEKSPFDSNFTISLANGYNGYLPTPKQHALGGYETWRARSSYLEVEASDKIIDTLFPILKTLKQAK